MGRNTKNFNNEDNNTSREINKIKKKQIMRKKRRRKRITSIILISLIVGVIGIGMYMYNFLSGLSNDTTLPGGIAPIGKQPVNILLLGLDIGDAEQAENKVGRRTDTMMVLNYNPVTKKAQIVSIPRDTYIEIEGTHNEYGGNYWKMNVAYAIDGEREITKQVEEMLEIKINYIVKIDYNAFRDIIDALGGIEMYIEQDMYYDDDEQDLHINFTGGETVQLDGKKAEEFFRWRYNNDGTGLENGDLDRIKNQQKLIKAVIKKALSPSIVPKIPKILDAVSKSLDTNMQVSEMIKYSKELIKINQEDIVMTTVMGEPKYINKESYIIYDRNMNLDILDSLQSGEVSSNTDENTNTEGTVSSVVKKEDLKIIVLNATKINGLAGGVQTELYNLGYGTVEIGNCDPAEKSNIMVENKDVKELLKSDTGIKKTGKISDSEYKDYDAVIVLGKDYDLFGE